MDGANWVQTAFTSGTGCPVGVSRPLDWSMLKTTALLPSWFTAISQRPDGSMLKLRATSPRVSAWPATLTAPDAWSIAKVAMSSDGPPEPRLEAYTQLPDGWTTTCADHLRPVQPGGSVDSHWISSKTPASGSQRNAVSSELSSLMT